MEHITTTKKEDKLDPWNNHEYIGNKNLGHETNQDSLKKLVLENNHNYKKKEQKFGLWNKSREHRGEKLVHGTNYE
jgi:hypothetical protein